MLKFVDGIEQTLKQGGYKTLSTMTFDTYRAVQDLKKAGLAEKQAAAIVAVIRWAVTGRYTSYARYFCKPGGTESS